MCGIGGILGYNSTAHSIESMLSKISHRGPDGIRFFKQGNIEFGHARLSIIDLTESANQPMIDPSSGNIIVFNGEIFNYVELKASLRNHYSFLTESDTEVILAAYSVWGIECLQKLQGMFALALFDKKVNKVLLVRDRFGIKPLYYRKIKDCLFFASEIKAIVNIDGIDEEVSEVKAYEFLANRQLDVNSQTLFQSVNQILPAHFAWVSEGGKIDVPCEYWQFPLLGRAKFTKETSFQLKEVFSDTIKLHLRSDVPVGSFLSGGIDSSSITCFSLQNNQQSDLHTFSAILPYFHPENILIDDVLNTSKRLIAHKFLLDGTNFFDDIPNIIYHHDEPIMDGSMYAHYKICELAKHNKIKVLLSGSGGDELFGGYASHIYAHHAGLLTQFRIKEYFKNIRKIKSEPSNNYENIVFKSLYECLPVRLRRFVKNQQLQKRNGHLQVKPFVKHFHFEHSDPYYANLLNNYKSWTVPPYLHYEDRNSMAFGIETRVPFMDHKLIEFVLQFASDELINGNSKSLMRKSFTGIVPDSVLQQKGKYGFPSPIDHALQTDKKGREIFFDLYKATPLLDTKNTAKIAKKFYSGQGNLTTFWRILSYIMWYDIFFTKKGVL